MSGEAKNDGIVCLRRLYFQNNFIFFSEKKKKTFRTQSLQTLNTLNQNNGKCLYHPTI